MPDFHVVKTVEPVTYSDATGSLSPGVREALLRAFARARLPEDDPLYAVLVAVAELNEVGATRLAELLKTTLDEALSTQLTEARKLDELLKVSSGQLKQAAEAIAARTQNPEHPAATLTAERLSGLEKLVTRMESAADRADGRASVLTNVSGWLVLFALLTAAVIGALILFLAQVHFNVLR
jgi:hypothetical protein